VGGDDTEAGADERGNLEPPAVPELGKPMQQDDQWPAPRLDVVETHPVDHRLAMVPLLRQLLRRRVRRRHCSDPQKKTPPPGPLPEAERGRRPGTTCP